MVNVIDLFSGAGGLSLGLSLSGLNIRGAVENNPHAVKTYSKNFTHPIINCDTKEVSGNDLLKATGIEKKGDLEILVGGPPCQGFSIQRRGEDEDSRNQLVIEFLRLVNELEPKLFLMENVPGLVNKRGREHLAVLKEMAEERGYLLHIKTLDASDYGVPQIRKRVFIVGEKPIDGKVFFSFPNTKKDTEEKITVRQAIGDLPSPPLDHSEHPEYPNHKRDKTSDINKLRISYVPEGGGREHIPEELQLACHRRASVEKAGHRYVYGRLAWDAPAGTITARFDSFTRGKFAHPAENRTITLREGARLQSFPDNFIFYGTKVEVARQIGNAVPPLLARALGESLKDAINNRNLYVKQKETIKDGTY